MANLESQIDELLEILCVSSTRELCGWLHAMWFLAANGKIVAEKYQLSSPQRQTTYLLGLAMTTPEPDTPVQLTEERWHSVCGLLEGIVETYVQPLMMTAAEGTVAAEKVHVASTAFMQRFMSGRLAVAEQLLELIRETCVPFDTYLRDTIGISASEATSIADWLLETLESEANAAQDAMSHAKKLHDIFRSNPTPEQITELQNSPAYESERGAIERFDQWSADPNTLEIAELEKAFAPELAAAFLHRFGLGRGQVHDFRYFASPNPPNPAELAPLVMRENGRFSVPLFAVMYGAMYDSFDIALRSGQFSERYLKRRSDYLERRTNQLVGRLFTDPALSIDHYYETSRAENEHDGLTLTSDNVLLAIEAKSAPMKTPSRDIERSFRNLSDQFKSSRGIQHAYEQALRVVDSIRAAKEPVAFYDAKGGEIAKVDPSSINDAFALCVTLESFGVIAVDPTLLLKVPDGADYPVIFNLYDLEALVEGFEAKGLAGKDFVEYLRQRRATHGRVQSDDELNLAGQFILEGHLIEPKSNEVRFVQGYADWFDDLYMKQHVVETGLMDEYVPRGISMGLTASLKAGKPVFVESVSQTVGRPSKVGRNDPCPCGSNKKYKKCHGAI